jgi:hypothetical protein
MDSAVGAWRLRELRLTEKFARERSAVEDRKDVVEGEHLLRKEPRDGELGLSLAAGALRTISVFSTALR